MQKMLQYYEEKKQTNKQKKNRKKNWQKTIK